MKLLLCILSSAFLQISTQNKISENRNQVSTIIAKKTVLDYYLKIPASNFMCDNYTDVDSKDYRINSIVRMDTRNGYLLSRHSDLIWLQVALFTYNSKDIIGVVAICGMGCMCNNKVFYEAQPNGDLKDVTSEIIPKESNDSGWFILPEKGTTIGIYDYDKLDQYDFKTMSTIQEKGLLHQLTWSEGKFKFK